MDMLKNIFKWLGLTIFALLIALVVQVPSVYDTPTFSYINQAQFNEATKQVNLFHNIFMIIAFSIIAFIMEWYLCKWSGNKLDFTQPLNWRNILLAIIAGVISVVIGLLIPDGGSSSKPGIFSATLHTKLAIPMILVLVVIGPTLEECLFRGGFQKGFFGKFNPWISIILASVIFAFFHNITINLYFLNNFISGFLFGYVYQKTDDIKMNILAHSVNNFIAVLMMIF